ncbi:AMP-binding protein [Streptomyces lasiicapitis]|uniref:AMP-binding protein n=1 Tax=Streptomyces lasiicapitis TaxID=1923961 RepID=UPI00364C7492
MTGLLLGEVFRSAARAVPHRTAAVLGARALTFAGLDAAADRAAWFLAAHGVRRGDRVVCLAGASLGAAALFAGAARAGAVFVPVDAGAGRAWVAEVVRAARAGLLLTDAARAEAGARLARSSAVRHVVLPDVDDAPDGRTAEQPEQPLDQTAEADPCVIVFTGSGRPRGVVLSHRVCVLRTHPGCRPERNDVLVCGFAPGQWSAWAALLRQWQARGTAVLLERPEPVAICAAVRGHGAERLVCAPGTWRGVLDTAPHHLASLRRADVEATGPPAAPGLLEDIRTATPHAQVRAFLTSPETGDVAVLDHADARHRPDSCGLPAPGTEVRVAGGELYVRGPLLCDGYADGKEAAARDGWFRTGWPAAAEADGHLCLQVDSAAYEAAERAVGPAPRGGGGAPRDPRTRHSEV